MQSTSYNFKIQPTLNVISQYQTLFESFLSHNSREKNILILTDESVEFDNRVSAQYWAALSVIESNNIQVHEVDNNSRYKVYTRRKKLILFLFINLLNLVKIIPVYIRFVKDNKIKLPKYPVNLTGIMRDLIVPISPIKFEKHYSIVVANNLKSLMYAINYINYDKLIFDSHEVEMFRKRNNNSHLRSVVNLILLNKLLCKPDKVVLFSNNYNSIIKSLIYKNSLDPCVIYNNHYPKITEFKKSSNKIVFIYFGYVTSSRGIDYMIKLTEIIKDSSLNIFSCGQNNLDLHLGFEAHNVMVYNDFPYYIKLEKLIKVQSENLIFSLILHLADNFSYRQALPNKFFQSVSARLPIICFSGTYIAEIVEKYNIGFVISPKDIDYGELDDLFNEYMLDEYMEMVSNFSIVDDLICNKEL